MTLTKEIQDAVVGALAPLAGLAGVPLIGRRRGIITNDIEAAVAQIGVVVFVFPPLPTEVNPEAPGPYIDRYEIRVRVMEAPALNATLPDAYELAEHILRALHHLCLPAVPGGNPILAARTPIVEIDDPERLIFDLIFSVSTGYPAPDA